MAGSAITAVIAAFKTALRADAGLTAIVGGNVYNNVPEGTQMPYVRIGNPTEIPFDLMGRQGRELTIQVIAASDYAGDKQAADIADRVLAVLNYAQLTLSGWTFVVSQFENLSSFDEEVDNRLIRHYPIVFRVIAQS